MTNNSSKSTTSKWDGTIGNVHRQVLEALARYKYLSYSQLLFIGVGTVTYRYLRERVVELCKTRYPLVRYKNFSTTKDGKLETIFFLADKGKQWLMQSLFYPEEEVRMPVSDHISAYHYFHRKYTVDFQIMLDKWAQSHFVEVLLFETYLDKKGNNRGDGNLSAATRIVYNKSSYIIPDGVFVLQLPSGNKRLFLFEVYDDEATTRPLKQLYQHLEVQLLGTPAEVYGIPQAYDVLLLFKHDSVKQALIERAKKDPAFKGFSDYFLLKSMEELAPEDFFQSWKTLDGNLKDLFG